MKTIRTLLLLVLAAMITLFAGCAKERTGPFDVPGATPLTKGTPGSSGGYGAAGGATEESLARAAAVIAATKVYFDFNKSAIRPDAHAALDRVAALLKEYPAIGINIEGHCDVRGGSEYNYGLGERRARAAYSQLVSRGINPAQVYMVTYGKEEPAVRGKTETAHAQNRRVEFIVTTTCR
ncbi:MAG: Peptidoglycan-associated lipoprotein [Desulfovibrio sp.]